MAALTLALFGAPHLERDGGVKISRRKILALLALSRHLSELKRELDAGMLMLDGEYVALRNRGVDVGVFATTVAAGSSATIPNLPQLLPGLCLPDCPEFDDWRAFHAECLRCQLGAILRQIAWAHAAAQQR